MKISQIASLLITASLFALSVCAEEPSLSCEEAYTNAEMIQCAGFDLDKADAQLNSYLKTSLEH